MPIDNFIELLVDEIDGKIAYATLGGMQDGRVVLGGVAGANGGSGAPPAGFVSRLNQRFVTYDTTEATVITTSADPSVVDNLNHIRYNVLVLQNLVESGVGAITSFIELTDTPTLYSGGEGGIPFINTTETGLLFSGEYAGLYTDELKLGPDRNNDFSLTKKLSDSGAAPTLFIETPASTSEHGNILVRDGENSDFPAGVALDNNAYAELDDDTTVPFTVGDFTYRILIAGVVLRGGRTVSTLTYNGSTLTSAGSEQPGGDVRVEIWYLLDPDVGNHNIEITCSTADDHLLFLSSFYNVASIGTFVSDSGGPTTSASQALTATYDAAVSVLSLQSGNGTRSATTGTEIDTYNYDSIAGGHSWLIIPAETSANWSFGTDYFALGVLHLNAQVGGDPLVNDNILDLNSTEIVVHKPTLFSGQARFGPRSEHLLGLNTVVSIDNTTVPPTSGELNSAFGFPTVLEEGFIGILNENDGDTDVYIVFTSDTSWYYLKGTKAT